MDSMGEPNEFTGVLRRWGQDSQMHSVGHQTTETEGKGRVIQGQKPSSKDSVHPPRVRKQILPDAYRGNRPAGTTPLVQGD